MQTELETRLGMGHFDSARGLLEKYIESGEIIDPRSDSHWTSIADTIAATVEKKEGLDSTLQFWNAVLDFFLKKIEPKWGHAHKGHIYFRLGFATARKSIEMAFNNFELAYKDDLVIEQTKGGTEEEIFSRSQNYSAYVALTILERVKEADLSELSDKQHFLDQLFSPSFDLAISGRAVNPAIVQNALSSIVSSEALSASLQRYDESTKAFALSLPFAVITLTGTVLESILLSILKNSHGLSSLTGSKKDILSEELGPLLKESIDRSIFPSKSIQAAFQLVHVFRNRLHPGNEHRQKYKLTPRVSMTVKILFDLAVLEWQKSLNSK